MAYIKGKNVNYEISADDAIALRQRGVPPAVLNAMLASGGGAPAPAAPAPVIPAPVMPVAPVAQVQPAPSMAVPPPQPIMQPMVAAPPTSNPDAAYFQQDLGPHGRWLQAEDGQSYWQPTIESPTRLGGRIGTAATGFTRMPAGTGRPIIRGAGWRFTMDDGTCIRGMAGFGSPAAFGGRHGSSGATAANIAAGRRAALR